MHPSYAGKQPTSRPVLYEFSLVNDPTETWDPARLNVSHGGYWHLFTPRLTSTCSPVFPRVTLS